MWSTAAVADTPRRLDIEEFRVEGNTVLQTREIEAAVYDFLGPDRSAADVEKARSALEELYQQRGYPTVTVEVPRQSADDGIVTMTVTERKVGRLRVTHSRYYEPDAIKQAAPSVAPGTVPNVKAVQRDMVALNQWPGRSVAPELRPGQDPDTMDVDLHVTDHFPLHGSLEKNNQYSANTTPLRLVGSIGYDNLWQRGDSVALFFQVAPQNTADAAVFATSYMFRIPDTNLSLLASYLKSNSNVASLGGTNVIGRGQIAGMRLLVPLPALDQLTHNFALGADYKDFDQKLTLGTTNDIPIIYYPITIGYNANWTEDTSRTDLVAAIVMGTPSLGSSTAVFENNRAYATPNFFYLRGTVTHTHDLPWGMQLWARLQGQGSGNALIPNEQFAAGGVYTVRGYLEAEVLGDNAVDIQTELRSPSFAEKLGPWAKELRVHLFADAAQISINDPLPGQRRSYGLGSVGFGVRARIADHFSAEVQNAVALSDGVNTKRGADTVLFRVLGDF